VCGGAGSLRRRRIFFTAPSPAAYESGVASSDMELHFIADDLEEHAWYVDLVADFVEDVEAFLAQLEEAI
jgi:hypothetical protein